MDATRRRGARVAREIGRDCLAVRVRLLNRAVTPVDAMFAEQLPADNPA
jgi:hypothetical protein